MTYLELDDSLSFSDLDSPGESIALAWSGRWLLIMVHLTEVAIPNTGIRPTPDMRSFYKSPSRYPGNVKTPVE
ncbi:hypothetical protein M8818_003770 [Zalaria obscura]|uniref:Uncharacterized protein n=1 Tax=Zalaria obscura TaxID=2024903 RepID=A0ACC3SEA4_9PEZI